MKKQIKLYLHHTQYEPITYDKRTGFFGFLKKVFGAIWYVIASTCYGAGFVLVTIILIPWKLLKSISQAPQLVLRIYTKLKSQQYQKTVAVFAVLAVLASSTVHGLNLIAAGQNIKGQVLGESTSGLDFLREAQVALESQNTVSAQVNLNKALSQFQNSKETLNSTGIALQGILSVVPQKRDADKLLSAIQQLTEAGIKGTQLLELTANLKLSAVGLTGTENNQKSLEQIQAVLKDSVDLANNAAELINDVSISSIPEEYQPTFIAAKDTSQLFLQNAATLKQASSLIFNLLLGSKNVLIVFQNNNELRASGGFMGTIGNAKLTNGSIDSLSIRSVYDWDGQLKEKILPPQPLYSVNDRWYLRDSNWFASFPQSAARISALYEKEGGETPDLIVMMTPEVILDMLERTGPIELPQHNITLTKENFIEKTQEATSVTYDKVINQPKQFLADFFPMLMQKLGSNEEKGGVMAFLEIFQQNLYKKQIILYSRDASIQKNILDFNWGGELKGTDRDYLSIVNSNLGGTKTDRAMQRTTELKSSIADDGTITNTLSYTIKNPLPKNPGLSNKSFLRVYVPENSQLISTEGFSNEIQLPRIDPAGYTLDNQVQIWQKYVIQDINTGTYTGIEANKTWFGNWVEVEGGETKTIVITYTLPFKLGNIDRHSLLIQKQPGTQVDSIAYELNFAGRNSLWNSSSSQMESGKLKYEHGLLADSFIGLVLQK